VLSKPFLGSEYELDFLLVANLTVGFSWTIVEIKSSDIALFRKDNKPAEALNAALYQVETYQAWIANHINYAREKYPNIYNPPGLIIIGRRHSLSDLHKQNLLHMNASRNIKIRTYDSFIDTLRFLNGLDFLAHNNKTTFLAKALQNLKNKFCYNPTNL